MFSEKIGEAVELMQQGKLTEAEQIINMTREEIENYRPPEKPSLFKYLMITLLTVVAILIIFMGGVTGWRYFSERSSSRNRELIDYMVDQLISGYEFDQIKSVMVENGYDEKFISRLSEAICRTYLIKSLQQETPDFEKIAKDMGDICPDEQPMVSLVQYIYTNIMAGYDETEIKKTLLEADYSVKEIQRAIDIIKKAREDTD